MLCLVILFYGTVLSINRPGGAVGTFVLSLMFDLTGNYNVVWPGCTLLMILSLLSILYCLRQAAIRKEKVQLSSAAEQPQAAAQ